MQPAIDEVILIGVGKRFCNVGDMFRMRHTHKLNGDICTPEEKGPAMTVTRGRDAWKWYCHRCGAGGYVSLLKQSPSDTAKRVRALKTKVEQRLAEDKTEFSIPPDTHPLYDEKGERMLTTGHPAYAWLMSYRMTQFTEKYHLGWSEHVQRIVMPIEENGELVGWVGRCPHQMSKANRNKVGRPKYLTYKKKGHGRLYYRLKGKDNTPVVIVEDIISAIRVHEATGFTTVALLNAGIRDELIQTFDKSAKIIIWLDENMLKESYQKSDRYRQLGYDCTSVVTRLDPKEYGNLYIDDLLHEHIKGGGNYIC
jgi:hypothetical protein